MKKPRKLMSDTLKIAILRERAGGASIGTIVDELRADEFEVRDVLTEANAKGGVVAALRAFGVEVR